MPFGMPWRPLGRLAAAKRWFVAGFFITLRDKHRRISDLTGDQAPIPKTELTE